MEQMKSSAFVFALDFSMQLNQTNPNKDYSYVVIEESDSHVVITEDNSYPIEDGRYNMVMFVDSQLKDAPIQSLEKWKKLLDRFSELDGTVFISIQYRPIPNDPAHESN